MINIITDNSSVVAHYSFLSLHVCSLKFAITHKTITLCFKHFDSITGGEYLLVMFKPEFAKEESEDSPDHQTLNLFFAFVL